MIYQETCTIISQEELLEGIFSMWLQADQIASEARAGQFLSLYVPDQSMLLPRPISLCKVDAASGRVRLVYRVTHPHSGTEIFSRMQAGQELTVMGPLGNGFPIERAKGRKVLLVGGGIGIPPLLETAAALGREGDRTPMFLSDGDTASVSAVLGYAGEPFMSEEFGLYADTYLASETGAAGTKGNVLDAIKANFLLSEADRQDDLALSEDARWLAEEEGKTPVSQSSEVIFACGPAAMLKAVANYAMERGIECWVSMEERMACGVGACLGCVCHMNQVDEHSRVMKQRVCKDGPVFDAQKVAW